MQVCKDANGNILKYLRNGDKSSTIVMDSLSYKYNAGTNQLNHVRDNVPSADYALPGYEDTDGQAVDNYGYDLIGNLTRDNAEHVSNIEWSVYGKITKISFSTTTVGATRNVYYYYDASGNRMGKRNEKNATTGTTNDYIWYVRDASGNVMAAYNSSGVTNDAIPGALTVKERHLYGSSRLGIFSLKKDVKATAPSYTLTAPYNKNLIRGYKSYELTNHLGNVLATISDIKFGHDAGNGAIDYYDADIVGASDYYPFGATMPNRITGTSYRYGFNGKEKDKEGSVQYDYGFRIYDPRLGRFKSVDPLQKKYPSLAPYSYCANNPIYLKDVDGRDVYVFDKDKNIVAVIRTSYKDIAIQVNYTSNREINTPVIQKTNDIWYSGHKSYEDAFVIGISYSQGKKVSVVGGAEIVLFTRGPDAGKPQVYGFAGVNAGVSKGSNVGISVAALNLYKPYGMIDDMRDKRIKADDNKVTKESYEGPFFATQLGIHNTIYSTNNTWPSPFGKITWFGEGATLTSLAISAGSTAYRWLGPLDKSDKGSVIPIDKSLQEKIDQFNKNHPKEDDSKKDTPATVPQAPR